MEDEIVLQDTQEPVEESQIQEQEIETTEIEAPEIDVDEVVQKNKELYARLKKTEAELKQFKSTPKEQQVPSTTNTSPDLDSRFERIELKTEGYSAEEVDFIMKNGGRSATQNEFVKAAITSMRAKNRSEEATPTSSAKSPVYKRHTRDELMNMSTEDLEKLLPHA